MFEMIQAELQRHSWLQLNELLLAFVLSSLIGLEREIKLKSAGLRTHALVGVGAALMMLVSKYGFYDVIETGRGADPARIAAQIVSGIGFIGGGLIFVRKDIVHGLTTAATIWLTTGVGMACGGGLPLLAIATTGAHFMIAIGYTRMMKRILGVSNLLNVRYKIKSPTAAAEILELCTRHGFAIRSFTMKAEFSDPSLASMMVRVQGSKSVGVLSEKIMKIPDVESIKVNVAKESDG